MTHTATIMIPNGSRHQQIVWYHQCLGFNVAISMISTIVEIQISTIIEIQISMIVEIQISMIVEIQISTIVEIVMGNETRTTSGDPRSLGLNH